MPTGKPGDYDFTPPFDAPPLGPDRALSRPRAGSRRSRSISRRHRLAGPDPLTQPRGTRATSRWCSPSVVCDSTTRTPDQTNIAFFWFEPFAIWNDITRTVVEQRCLDPWQAARVFALVNFAMMDAGIACFDAKYRFRFWRPYTAIRRAAEDGNDGTEPDPDWLPLLWTPPEAEPPTFLIPPIPDYPSAAATHVRGRSRSAARALRRSPRASA